MAAESLIYRPRSLDPTDREVALHKLHHAISLGRGPVVVTGGPGSGKTHLCRAIVQQVEGSAFSTLVLDPVASEDELIKRMLQGFGIVADAGAPGGITVGASASQRLEALQRFLDGLPAIDATATLVVDDAQNLPAEALARIARLADFQTEGAAKLQVVLVGQPPLRDILRSPALVAFERRVSTRWELEPPEPPVKEVPSRPHRKSIAPALAVVLLGSAIGAGLTAFVYQRLGL